MKTAPRGRYRIWPGREEGSKQLGEEIEVEKQQLCQTSVFHDLDVMPVIMV